MSKNTSDIRFGPISNVAFSSSFGEIADIGYVEGADVTFEPAPISTNDQQMFQGTGLAKLELRTRQSDPGLIASASVARSDGAKFTITGINGTVYTCGPALCYYTTTRPFEAGEGHMITFTIQKQVADESDFIVQS